MCLKEISKKHLLWKKMAFGITKDKYLADDIVSEMYIKICNSEKEMNEVYIYFVLKSCFIDWIRNENKIQTIEITQNLIALEPITIVSDKKIPEFLTFSEKEILRLRQDFSCRELGEAFNLNKTKVFRIEKKAKEKIQLWKKTSQLD